MSLRDDLLALMERITNDHTYPVHVHVVHPRAVGWTRCADCGSAVYVKARDDE